jgi:hypothetical protein
MDVTFDQIKKQYAVEVERANTLESPEAHGHPPPEHPAHVTRNRRDKPPCIPAPTVG